MFGSYLFILRRRLVNIVVLMLPLVPLAFLYLTSLPPVYESRAVLEVGTGSLSETLLGVSRPYEEPVRRVASIADVVTSRPVTELASGYLRAQGREPGRVQAEPRRASDYIDITATGPAPVEANAITNAYVTAFFEQRRLAQEAELEELEDGLVDRQEAAERQLAATEADTPEQAAAVENVESTARLLQTVRLRQEVPPTGVDLLSTASTPLRPSNELSPILAMLLSLVGVFFVASGITLLLELIRDAVRTRDEVERLTQAPVLGEIVGAGRGAGSPADQRRDDGRRTARLGLLARSGGTLPSSVLITSLPDDVGDGLVAAVALAEGCAESGQRVVLVADVPSGASTSLIPADRPSGERIRHDQELSPVPLQGRTFSWCPATSVDGRRGLLDLQVPKRAMDDLLARFDLVILAPGTPGVEPTDVAYLTAATVVVCSIGRTHGRHFARFLEVVEHELGPVRGVLLTLPAPAAKTGRRGGIFSRRKATRAARAATARPSTLSAGPQGRGDAVDGRRGAVPTSTPVEGDEDRIPAPAGSGRRTQATGRVR